MSTYKGRTLVLSFYPLGGKLLCGAWIVWYDWRMTPLTENVLSVLDRASDTAWDSGMSWYDVAHNEAIALDARFHRSAGVIAALSPMNEWNNNLRKAQALYAANGIVTFGPDNSNGYGLSRNVRKAVRIYHGEDAMDVLNGDKVTSFYLSIVDPRFDTDPVIDRHAFDIAVGMRTNDDARKILTRKSVYREFVSVYREAAAIAGILPKQLQAITWVAWKETL